MPKVAENGKGVFLRTRLREDTRQQHDALDARAAAFDLSTPAGYARFLSCQLAARLPVENYIATNVSPQIAPPPTAPLLIADLEAMGLGQRGSTTSFTMPAGADPLGLAWALAGSHLGNRAMLLNLGETTLPTAFLNDQAMIAFWRKLRPMLEREVPAEEAMAASNAARALFDTFLRAFSLPQGQLAA